MTASLTLFQRANRFVVVALVSSLAFLLGTASLSAAASPSSNRFLFIVDTSASMKEFEKGLQTALFDLIASGVRGQMTNGDTYGIWLAGEETDMSFKMEVWRQKFTVEMGARAAQHVMEHGFKGKLDMTVTMNDAISVLRNVGDLTLVFISNGETPFTQTPFDTAINARFRELAPVMKRKKATINTVLAGRDGKVIAWAVNSPDYVVEVPYVPPKPKPALQPAVTIAAVPRATNFAAPAAAPDVTEPPKARANVAPIIITKDVVAHERRQFLALASTLTNGANTSPNPTLNTNIAASVPTNSIASNAVSTAPQPAPPPMVSTTAVQSATSAIATLKKTEPTEPTNVVPVAASAPTATVSSASPAPANSAVSAISEATSESHPLFWAAIGAGAAFVCMMGVLLVIRGRRIEPSLVSQAMIREQMRVG